MSWKERHLHGLLKPWEKRKSSLQKLVECVPLETLVAELTVLEPGGKRSLKARCYCHAEKSPSLRVVRRENGKTFVHCFGCGAHATNALEALEFMRGETLEYMRGNDQNHWWGPEHCILFLSKLAGVEILFLPKKKRRYPRTRKKKK